MNSRDKGARFERELAARLRKYGYEARRGQQYSGANGDADVVGLPGIHIEAKAVEHLNIWDAMAQSERDVREGEMPIVCHTKNRKRILTTMRFKDFMQLYERAKVQEVIDAMTAESVPVEEPCKESD